MGMLLVVIVLTGLTARGAADIEVLEEYGCQDNAFQLTCRTHDVPGQDDGPATIAVLEASFSARDAASIFLGANRTCGKNHTGEGPRYIRAAVNRRCSGVNHCSFILNSDFPPSEDWGPGLVHIKYACISGPHVHRYCSANAEVLVADEGFLQSPGYPAVTVGERSCLWKVRTAGKGQQLQLRVLDLSLRAQASSDEECVDSLAVREGAEDGAENADLIRECGEREDDDEELVVESERGALDVNLTTRSVNAFPSRGVLIHFKAVGCPNLPPPVDGYQVHRNETTAWYLCSVGFVFADSELRARTLVCDHGNTWNDTLPACVNVSSTSTWRRAGKSSWTFSDGNSTKIRMAASENSDNDTMSSVIVPSVIMAMLFLGNGLVLYVLFVLRKRHKKKCVQDEERAAIVKANGSSRETKIEEEENVTEEVKASPTVPSGSEVVDAQC